MIGTTMAPVSETAYKLRGNFQLCRPFDSTAEPDGSDWAFEHGRSRIAVEEENKRPRFDGFFRHYRNFRLVSGLLDSVSQLPFIFHLEDFI